MNIVRFNANNAPVIGYLHEDHDRLVEHKTRPALLICAGGCYRHLSPREQDPVALAFSALGYQTFLLIYSTGKEASSLRPLKELAAAVKLIRERSEEWHIEAGHVAVLGFSAGGHLAASLGTLWDHPAVKLGRSSCPDALILCYPVITTGEFRHAESIDNVTGGDPEMLNLLSLENQVTGKMPPTFLWHCTDDESVPVENSLMLLSAMQREGVPYECHFFMGGAHGVSLCNQEVETVCPEAAAWLPLCQSWLNRQFSFTP